MADTDIHEIVSRHCFGNKHRDAAARDRRIGQAKKKNENKASAKTKAKTAKAKSAAAPSTKAPVLQQVKVTNARWDHSPKHS